MSLKQRLHEAGLVRKGPAACEVVDLFGPVIQFVTAPDEADERACWMKGTIPPGVSIPLHSHADAECFWIFSGEVEALVETVDGSEWVTVKTGEFIEVPSRAKHAFRNNSSAPVMCLIQSTSKLGRFFKEIGRPWTPGSEPKAPTAEELQRFVVTAAKYQYWLADAEENAARGMALGPAFSGFAQPSKR